MSCCFSKKKLRIKVGGTITIGEGNEFDYLRPNGRHILKMDNIYNVPEIDILFDDWYANSIRL